MGQQGLKYNYIQLNTFLEPSEYKQKCGLNYLRALM